MSQSEPSDGKDYGSYSCPAFMTIAVEVLSASDETMALNALIGVLSRFDHLPLQAQERMLRYMLERVQGP